MQRPRSLPIRDIAEVSTVLGSMGLARLPFRMKINASPDLLSGSRPIKTSRRNCSFFSTNRINVQLVEFQMFCKNRIAQTPSYLRNEL